MKDRITLAGVHTHTHTGSLLNKNNNIKIKDSKKLASILM